MQFKLNSRFLIIFILLIASVLACSLPQLPFGIGNSGTSADNETLSAEEIEKIPVGLQLESPDANGTVKGLYRSPKAESPPINFNVTQTGEAIITLLSEESTADQIVVNFPSESYATLTYDGVEMDGFGELTVEEKNALMKLATDEIALSSALMPLELGCKGEEAITPQQLAALLFPWQMQLKYLHSNRSDQARMLEALSSCKYFEGDGTAEGHLPPIQLSMAADAVVPVVIGYFPFDFEGAVDEPEEGLGNESNLLPSTPTWSSLTQFPGKRGGVPHLAAPLMVTETDKYGSCGSKCRGACGAGCTTSNCKQSELWKCEIDPATNLPTNYYVRYDVFECGIHQGCISHDACYDACNRTYGCSTWRAANCRHTIGDLIWGGDIIGSSCDGESIGINGRVNCSRWALGYGPFTDVYTYEYSDPDSRVYDPTTCPTYGVEPQKVICEGYFTSSRTNASTNKTCTFTHSFKLELWNVGALGGAEFAGATFYWDYVNYNSDDCSITSVDARTTTGEFPGGPNGSMTIGWANILLSDGEVAFLTYNDTDGVIMYDGLCTILNPEAFTGWTGP